ncbi:MAG: butyrate kinase [Oscillospiraceae bacterium]|nr:butyrate kinase [Oscillospiraceae bacterium]
MFKILSINPGSTSTKVGVFIDKNPLFIEKLSHSVDEINKYKKIKDQYEYRLKNILNILKYRNLDFKSLDAVVSRGGLLKPLESGTYLINELMLEHLKESEYGEHAANLGAIIANEISSLYNIPGFIVDPIVVDELQDCARFSGISEIKRKSIFHALNQKAIAKRYARENALTYENLNLIVAHLGGGISVACHKGGRIIDVNNALNGEGPFSAERSGELPAFDLVKMCFSGHYTEDEILRKIAGKGGMVSYLNTNDMVYVLDKVESLDREYTMVYDAFIYQIGKEIGKCAVVLKGEVDSIIITGGIAYSKKVVRDIEDMVKFIARVIAYPGEDELLALVQGVLRVLNHEEKIKEYV